MIFPENPVAAEQVGRGGEGPQPTSEGDEQSRGRKTLCGLRFFPYG